MLNRYSSARTAADSSTNDEVTTSSHTCTKPNVVRRIGCLLFGHYWGGFDNNICQKCYKKAVGLPKFIIPPFPPKSKPT